MPSPTPQQLKDLFYRRKTAQQLSEELHISLNYVYKLYPGRIPAKPRENKSALIATRKLYRTDLAKQVLAKTKTLKTAAAEACCSLRTMRRSVNAITIPTS